MARRIVDDENIPIHSYKGKLNYHPVYLALRGLSFLSAYEYTKDDIYLNWSVITAEKLDHIALKIDSALYFPYTFNFSLHGCKEETMEAPWYSGMAQGQALSLFIRLYEITHEKYYLDLSNKVFKSFTNLKGKGYDPWVSCIDSSRNLWLEEYPRDLPCFALNGMIFAIYGLYDYYRVTNNQIAKVYLLGALTTIKENISRYRNINDISYYCLKHNNFRGKNPNYHKVHIQQLNMLYRMTRDDYFKQMEQNFISDTVNLHK